MGKRIVSQARGHGSLTYRIRRQGYRYRIGYPALSTEGKAKIIKLIHSPGHSSPLLKIKAGKDIFYNIAFQNAFEGQEIDIGRTEEAKQGDILKLKDIEAGNQVYNIETRPGDGGKLVRSGGSSAVMTKKEKGKIFLLMPSKKTIKFHEECRATLGVAAAGGRLDKPIVKAGKRFHAMKAKGRKWHFTSPVKVNAVDHPFGGGRGKRIKSKIAKRNAPPGKKVGHLLPRQTGRKKRR